MFNKLLSHLTLISQLFFTVALAAVAVDKFCLLSTESRAVAGETLVAVLGACWWAFMTIRTLRRA